MSHTTKAIAKIILPAPFTKAHARSHVVRKITKTRGTWYAGSTRNSGEPGVFQDGNHQEDDEHQGNEGRNHTQTGTQTTNEEAVKPTVLKSTEREEVGYSIR